MVLSVIKVRSGCISVASEVFKEKNKQTAISTIFNIADILRSLFLSLVEADLLWRLAVCRHSCLETPPRWRRQLPTATRWDRGARPRSWVWASSNEAPLVVRGGKPSGFGAAAGRSWPSSSRVAPAPRGLCRPSWWPLLRWWPTRSEHGTPAM